jgi:hypothetical protein
MAVMLGAGAAAQGTRTFKARLSWIPIDAAMAATVAGSGTATATLSGTRLSVTGSFEGLRSPATAARLHRGVKGVRGPALSDLTIARATSGAISGELELTAPQVEDLGRERFYVMIHSEQAPEGNLWGWLLQQEGGR